MKTIMKNVLIKMKDNRGYALLFAVLVSAVVLGVGVSILNIARKEILLTASAQQSQYAFYAADTGYECAIYEDLKLGAFSTTTQPSPFSCGATYTGSVPAAYASAVTMTQPQPLVVYQYVFNVPISQAGSCAIVTVTKTYSVVGSSTVVSTGVISDGFNVGSEGFTGAGAGDCGAINSTKVERALSASY